MTPHPSPLTPHGLPDDDLSCLSPEDLARVVRWVEDRMINAITPLDIRLQQEMPGTMAADRTLQEARAAVRKVMAAVEELRAVSRESRAERENRRMIGKA